MLEPCTVCLCQRGTSICTWPTHTYTHLPGPRTRASGSPTLLRSHLIYTLTNSWVPHGTPLQNLSESIYHSLSYWHPGTDTQAHALTHTYSMDTLWHHRTKQILHCGLVLKMTGSVAAWIKAKLFIQASLMRPSGGQAPLRVGQHPFKSQFCHRLTRWPWTSYYTIVATITCHMVIIHLAFSKLINEVREPKCANLCCKYYYCIEQQQ